VIGPGTGLGEGFMVKSKSYSDYVAYPSEGGHVDFPGKTKQDQDLMKFARTYIE